MVFEVSSSGHRLGYVHLLLRALAERRLGVSVVFALSDDFRGRLESSLVSRAQRANDVQIVFMSSSETRSLQKCGFIGRRLNTFSVFERYLAATGSQLGFVNYLDTILLGFALPYVSRNDAAVAGILFRPTVHYPSLGVLESRGTARSTRLKEWLVRRSDDLIYRRALKNPRLVAMLSLDPLFSQFARRRYPQGEKVRTLAEPYSAAWDAGHKPEDERTRLLIFGGLTDRKGLLETLDALLLLSDAELGSMSLIVAGRIHEDIRTQVRARVNSVRRLRPALHIETRDEYIADMELATLIESTDVIVAPYRRHVGSSGVLALAAHHRRPVISQRYGLMGALVERYQLGVTCDPEDPEDLARCLRRVLLEDPQNLIDPVKMADYAATNGEEPFIDSTLEILELAAQSDPV